MNKLENLQAAKGGRGSKEAKVDDSAHSNRQVISLTEDLKNDSVLGTNKERRSTGNHRVCRCSQIQMLKEKTIEKIRKSIEAEYQRPLTATDEQSYASEKVKKESIKTEKNLPKIANDGSTNTLVESKVENLTPKESLRVSSKIISEVNKIQSNSKRSSEIATSFISDSKAQYLESRRISSNLLEETGKPYRISDFPPARESIRVSTIQDSDIFENLDKFHEKEQERIEARKSTKESRYTDIFFNDFCGSFDPIILEDQDEFQQQARRLTIASVDSPLQTSTRRSTFEGNNQDDIQKRRSSRVQRYTEIYDNDMIGCILEVPDDDKKPEIDTNRSSKEQRYSNIYDNDMFSIPVALVESAEFLNLDQLKQYLQESETIIETPREEIPSKKSSLLVPISDPQKSTRTSRYTEVFNNDMFGGIGMTENASKSSSVRGSIVTIPQTKFDHGRSSMQKRYTEIFENDMLGGTEHKLILPEVPSRKLSEVETVILSETPSRQSSIVQQNDVQKTPSRQSSARQSIATDLQNSVSKEQSKISINTLQQFINEVSAVASEKVSQLAESSTKITQHDAAPTRHSCSQKVKICSESCTSHLKPHQCSLQPAPSCSPSCTTCKPFTDRNSAQYDADDERSSSMLNAKNIAKPSSSSIKPQQDQTFESTKIQNPERVCSCSKNYPDLFEKVLSK